jgi:phosphoribosylaminoimidazole-succinocarboxamide synthase
MPTYPTQTNLREVYDAILKNPADEKLWQKYLWEGPTQSDIAKWQGQGYGVYQGKIRTVLNRDGRIQMLHSDRLTAFDCLISNIPGKGVLLNTISKWWFEQLKGVVSTHYVESPAPRAMVTESCVPIKAEVVVRGYLAGSLLRAYEKGERLFCGMKLPDGLKPYERLPEPIITPTTKAAAFEHDENITGEELIAKGVCSKNDWDEISQMALKVFSIGTRLYAEKGWILVDTKYEFGRGIGGKLKLIDEVHTPDCSRLWIKATYEERVTQGGVPEMLDKENVRRWLLDQGFTGHGPAPHVPRNVLIDLAKVYLHVAETLTGTVVMI